MAETRPAVFLDRDGVLNYNRTDHIKRPEEYLPIPGAAEAVARLKRTGWAVVVVSNQSGLARGLFGEEALAAIMTKMQSVLAAAGGGADAVYYCPHAPEAGCDCRKPAPGLLLRAQRASVRLVPAEEMVLTVCGESVPIRGRADLSLTGGYTDVARAVLTTFDTALDGRGFHLEAETEIPMRAGLSGSTAMLVAILG